MQGVGWQMAADKGGGGQGCWWPAQEGSPAVGWSGEKGMNPGVRKRQHQDLESVAGAGGAAEDNRRVAVPEDPATPSAGTRGSGPKAASPSGALVPLAGTDRMLSYTWLQRTRLCETAGIVSIYGSGNRSPERCVTYLTSHSS